jgi:hypothetical protein
MDRLTFMAQLIGALAWPVTAIVCVLLLRGFVTALVPLLRKLKYSDLELQFGREVAELKGAADAVSLPGEKATSEQRNADTWQELVRLAAARPRSAIRGAWQEVEGALKRTATGHGLQAAPGAWSMPMVLGALLLNAGVVTEAHYDLLSRLRRLATEAERAPVDSISSESAADFVGLALRFAASLPPSGDRPQNNEMQRTRPAQATEPRR